MGKLERQDAYSIPVAGLVKGTHLFDYEIDDSFFASFESSLIQSARVKVTLTVLKAETGLTLTFHLRGVIHHHCDRCLEPLDLPADTDKVLVVKYGTPGEGDDDEVVVISPDEHHFNIASHLYDYLTLMVPIRAAHPDDAAGNPGCNPEVLRNINVKEEEKPADPRWEALKKLTSENNDKKKNK